MGKRKVREVENEEVERGGRKVWGGTRRGPRSLTCCGNNSESKLLTPGAA